MNKEQNNLKTPGISAGISFRRGPAQWQKALGVCTGAEGVFDSAEFPSQVLDKSDLKGVLAKHPWLRSWHLADTFSASLSRSIADQSAKIVNEFKSHFCHLLDRASEAGASSLQLDLGLDMAERDPRLLDSRLAILKSLAAALHGRGMVLCLPLRLPASSPGMVDFMLRCLRDAGHPAIRLAVDFYPHELSRKGSGSDYLRMVRFDAELLRVCYEPELGNHLTLPLLAPCLDYWRSNSCRGALLFAPATADQERFHSELGALSGIFSEWLKALHAESNTERKS